MIVLCPASAPPSPAVPASAPARRVSGQVATGWLLITGALLANAAFAALGGVFGYPDVLREPAPEILRRFDDDAARIGGLFLLLAVAAGLLGPIAVRLSRLLGRDRLTVAATWAGVAAAAVQVAGLLRWPLAVPFLAGVVADPATAPADRDQALDVFTALHAVLGQVVGEAVGYTLTVAWTVLIAVALRRARLIGRAVGVLGLFSGGLILAGLLEPLGAPGAGLANFAGYVAWSLWLVAVGVALIRDARGRVYPSASAA